MNSPELSGNDLFTFMALAATALDIPHLRTNLDKGLTAVYYTKDEGSIYAQEFNVCVPIPADITQFLPALTTELRKIMEGRRSAGVTNGTDPLAKTTRVPLVLAFRNTQITDYHDPHMTMMVSKALVTTVCFYEDDCEYYTIANGERLYPKAVIAADAELSLPNAGDFGNALEYLRVDGRRVRRQSWPAGQYLVFVPGSPKLTVDAGRPLARAGVPVGTEFSYAEHIDLFEPRVQGAVFGAWTPTQADILANDWTTVDA